MFSLGICTNPIHKLYAERFFFHFIDFGKLFISNCSVVSGNNATNWVASGQSDQRKEIFYDISNVETRYIHFLVSVLGTNS